jgi:hypothetical protein
MNDYQSDGLDKDLLYQRDFHSMWWCLIESCAAGPDLAAISAVFQRRMVFASFV